MRVTLVLIYTLQAIEIKSYGNKINHFERKSGRNLCIHKYVHMKTFALFLFIKYTIVHLFLTQSNMLLNVPGERAV